MARKFTVIADDITGAAEIAGIGYSFGLKTILMTEPDESIPDCDLLVFATDTRSMSRQEAIDETRRVVGYLKRNAMGQLFKKTDSALRGHIAAELQTILDETVYDNVLLLPQNPSKGRIVCNGIYYIGDKPLQETPFAYDPEFPAHSSYVHEIVQSFSVTDAINFDQVTEAVNLAPENSLMVGGADLFTACLLAAGFERKESQFVGLNKQKTLIVCGSTQSSCIENLNYIRNNGIPTLLLSSSAFYEGILNTDWTEKAEMCYAHEKGLILTTAGYAPQEGKDFAVRLRNTMARIVELLSQQIHPNELIIEGGATAFTILRKLNWKSFCLTDEISPGVVRMKCMTLPDTYITLKPGSYSWGNLFG